MLGILQPFSDAIKLFCKESIFPRKRNFLIFRSSPIILIFLILIFWLVLPLNENCFKVEFRLLFFLALLRLNVYPLFLAGWSSNSKYGMIGAVRGISQAISYEISLALIFLNLCLFSCSVRIAKINNFNRGGWFIIFLWPLLILWLVRCVAETNRTPFDFSEGESELVSGFNIEYGRVIFAVLFIREYGIILFFSFLRVAIFLNYNIRFIFFIFVRIIFVVFWIWLRATFPRFRYDKLMNLGWKVLLPFILCFVFYFFGVQGMF